MKLLKSHFSLLLGLAILCTLAFSPAAIWAAAASSSALESPSRFTGSAPEAVDNAAPKLDHINNQTIDEGALVTFTATASDRDGDPLTFSLGVTAPDGSSLDPLSGDFAWQTDETDGPGVYNFEVCVSDSALQDCQNVRLTVLEVNTPPTLDPIGNKVIAELNTLSFTATASDIDLPPNTLTFSLGATAPLGASIDPTSGDFTWTPTESQGPADHTFEVCVSDGSATVCETITVTVNEVNTPPVLDPIGDKTVNALSTLSFVATASDADIPTSLTFSLDPGYPPGAVITPQGLFTWTPTLDQAPGVYPVTVRVSDSGEPPLDDFETINIAVTDNPTDPQVSWILPVSDGLQYDVRCEDVILEVEAVDDLQVDHVTLSYWDYVAGTEVEIGVLYTAPYRTTFNTCGLNPEFNQVNAVAYDITGADSGAPVFIWLYRYMYTVFVPVLNR